MVWTPSYIWSGTVKSLSQANHFWIFKLNTYSTLLKKTFNSESFYLKNVRLLTRTKVLPTCTSSCWLERWKKNLWRYLFEKHATCGIPTRCLAIISHAVLPEESCVWQTYSLFKWDTREHHLYGYDDTCCRIQIFCWKVKYYDESKAFYCKVALWT